MHILVTGSSGLIGSEAVNYFDRKGHHVVGVDNNMRRVFFGKHGDTTWNLKHLRGITQNFSHRDVDIRDRERIFKLFKEFSFDLIIHCAGQPSHDKAAEIPLVDFEVNALGTMNLLEATRQYCSDAVFILMSTNKVYGDSPNELSLKELKTRYDYAKPEDFGGIDENCRLDQSLHSIFGASKVAADIMAQEYGRYYGLNVGVLRGGCMTGPNHSGVELHGFLSYLVKVALTDQTYIIYGYKGKQVRDNIHSYDVIRAIEEFTANPRPGEVYNIGGGRENSTSVLEAISLIEEMTGREIRRIYRDPPRKGDHICYISDLRKLKAHYPNWQISNDLKAILEVIINAWNEKNTTQNTSQFQKDFIEGSQG